MGRFRSISMAWSSIAPNRTSSVGGWHWPDRFGTAADKHEPCWHLRVHLRVVLPPLQNQGPGRTLVAGQVSVCRGAALPRSNVEGDWGSWGIWGIWGSWGSWGSCLHLHGNAQSQSKSHENTTPRFSFVASISRDPRALVDGGVPEHNVEPVSRSCSRLAHVERKLACFRRHRHAGVEP